MAWFVGAYAIVPKVAWSPADEMLLLEEARTADGFSGWEVPFQTSLHPHDQRWFLNNLARNERLVVTLIPGVMQRLGNDPLFGLASSDGEGRRRAIEFARTAQRTILATNRILGRRAVQAVEIHSAPGGGRASVPHFAESLAEIGGWDWGGAELLVEHCDAHVLGQPSAKGFLDLQGELDAISAVNVREGHRFGVILNWARSAIEGRDASTPLAHIGAARSQGLLRGFMFSGCSASPISRGGAWADFHLPPVAADDGHSQLTAARLTAAMLALGDPTELAVFGMKVGAAPTDTLMQRRDSIRESGRLIRQAASIR
ncbi:DUF4862 family protein [Subtercola lobariae]|uniref:DUF4862 domain-containing protein n=1 Tax=Subtercola lobariae TaxID=1588641 RepID=A0A917BFS0_9MICO|nr:DUF4862 family protein [Subtercola lobariae]GGF41839.1 DUF4862 domain-containing protein [Subtercola lobariae]